MLITFFENQSFRSIQLLEVNQLSSGMLDKKVSQSILDGWLSKIEFMDKKVQPKYNDSGVKVTETIKNGVKIENLEINLNAVQSAQDLMKLLV